jgi:hypothetical protein
MNRCGVMRDVELCEGFCDIERSSAPREPTGHCKPWAVHFTASMSAEADMQKAVMDSMPSRRVILHARQYAVLVYWTVSPKSFGWRHLVSKRPQYVSH